MSPLYELKIYQAKNGHQPFIEWLESLDNSVRYRVKERLDRVRLGNLGDYKSVSEGVYELRLNFGSGYRIYFAKEKKSIILLLVAGNKSVQVKNIKQAKQYWDDYLREDI